MSDVYDHWDVAELTYFVDGQDYGCINLPKHILVLMANGFHLHILGSIQSLGI